MPATLTQNEPETGRFQSRHVGRLVGGVGDGEVDVDHRLGGQARHRCRPDVVEVDHARAERLADAIGHDGVNLRPRGVVGNHADRLRSSGRRPPRSLHPVVVPTRSGG